MKLNFIQIMKQVVSKLYSRLFQKSMFCLTMHDRQEIIQSFPEPQDRIERSYFQYCCHMHSTSSILQFFQNLMAIPAMGALWLFSNGDRHAEDNQRQVAVYISDGIGKEIIPESLQREFTNIVTVEYKSGFCLGNFERKWIGPVWKKYWKSPYFILKCYIKMGIYANQLKFFSPSAIIVYNEYSFTSSLLTEYCQACAVKHINVLHGEKLYNTRDAFVSYHRFYVWDNAYRKLFLCMRAEKSQFRIEMPPMLLLSLPKKLTRYNLTYYLDDQDRKHLLELHKSLELLRAKGYRVCVRFHPRFGDRKEAEMIFSDYFTEAPEVVALMDSLAYTEQVCSIASTVLYQATRVGRSVVLDDVSNHEKFALLVDLGYTMLTQPHTLLSDLLRMNST